MEGTLEEMTEFGNVMFTATTMLLEGYDKVQSLRNVFSSVDGGATVIGAGLGTTSLTTYVESGVGIAEG